MARLTKRYAAALLDFAKSEGKLEEIYRQALPIVKHSEDVEYEPIGKELAIFLKHVLENDVEPVMRSFVELARQELGILDVEIIAPVKPLPEQLARIEERLIRLSNKRVDMEVTIDPELIGGLRIIAGDVVIDNTIKVSLNDIKEKMYEGVYFGK